MNSQTESVRQTLFGNLPTPRARIQTGVSTTMTRLYWNSTNSSLGRPKRLSCAVRT